MLSQRANFRSEGSLNQHIKLKHNEYYIQMSANNPNMAGMSKRDSSCNDGKSMNSESFEDGSQSGGSSDNEQSYSLKQGQSRYSK